MRKIVLLIVMVFALCEVTRAVVVQKIILKNGSELNGYIEKQDDNANLTFHSDYATIYLNDNEAKISNEKSYDLKSLDKLWVEWAEKNEAFVGVGDNRSLFLGDVSMKDKTVSKVRILERGIKVKFLQMAPDTYHIAWKDVEAIKGQRRSKTALSGINRIYQLKNGTTFEGEYAEENDSILSLYLNNGIVQSLRISDVVKYTFRPINPNQDIFAQSELLDVVKTANREVKGIIIEQNYTSKKDTENYFLVQQKTGAIQSIKVSEMQEIRKEENPDYKPLFDILLKEGEIVINRKTVEYVTVKENEGYLILDSLSSKVIVDKGENNSTKVVVEYRNANGANVEAFQLVKVTKFTFKKKESIYGFSYKDLVNAVYRPVAMETSVNHTTKAKYIVGGQGAFALYDAKNRRAIPFIVK